MLQVTFHRRMFSKKFEWQTDVEIFHRDLGWEARGVKGILEVVRGQEGADWPPKDLVEQLNRQFEEQGQV
jgi:hypothetical protein